MESREADANYGAQAEPHVNDDIHHNHDDGERSQPRSGDGASAGFVFFQFLLSFSNQGFILLIVFMFFACNLLEQMAEFRLIRTRRRERKTRFWEVKNKCVLRL